jgi:hypothetical protein
MYIYLAGILQRLLVGDQQATLCLHLFMLQVHGWPLAHVVQHPGH